VSVRVYIGLGANLGQPAACLRWALDELARAGPTRASSLYRSEPLGGPGQPWYVNAVAEHRTGRSPRELLDWLQALERLAGRPPERARWAARVLDLDVLLYGDWEIRDPGLMIPHKGLAERRFVLEPLAELAPDALDPRTGRSARDLLAALDDPLRVEKLPPERL
jgi:2-amino-4-hydroxy-6-hydroxymethyldihydropteridine diphosphokinase